MELHAKPRTDAHERCPYCHDMLAETQLTQIECPGCKTIHHVVCIQELGRCTIQGCAQAIDVPEPDRSWEDSPELRKVRRRLRDRVKQFVGTHAKNRRDRLINAIERASTLESEKRYKAAADAYDDLVYLERLPEIRSDSSLGDVPGRMTIGHARAKAREMRERQNTQFGRSIVLLFAIIIILPMILTLVLALGLDAF